MSYKTWTMTPKPKIYDTYGVLESISWIWRITGVFPFTMQGPMSMAKYGLNKFWALYCILLCVTSITNLTSVISMFLIHSRADISIAPLTMCIRAAATLSCMTISNILRIFNHKKLTQSIEMMEAQDVIIKKLNCRLNYEISAKFVSAYVWGSVSIVLFLMAYDYYASMQAWGMLVLVMYVYLQYWVCWFVPFMAQVVDLTIFSTLVALLGFKFRALNDKIISIATRSNASSPKVIVNSHVCAEKLQLLAKCHYHICAIGKEINRFFDWVTIINVINAFIVLSTTLYYIFVEIQRDDQTDYIRIGTYIHWECVHSVPIIGIVMICNWTSNQGESTGTLIHEIRVQKSDPQLHAALKSFSLQLHHQKPEFTACGFFPLNSSLLQTMLGHISTYLVILIQFQPKLD